MIERSISNRMIYTTLIALVGGAAIVVAEVCNPLQVNCSDAIPGLTQTYTVDFTKENQLHHNDWILANYAFVNFSTTHGLNFTFNKRYDAPYIWSRDYFLFGRVDVELQAAPGIGLVTGSVLMSDAKDEIDWEFSGNNFGKDEGWVQTNWFGKGITGSYNRGTQERVDSPQTQFHTYTFDWTKDGCKWLIDGKEVHSMTNNGDTNGELQYPQTPARLHLGIWNAGDPETAESTRQWAAGSANNYLDLSKVPYSGYVRSVKITPYMPCSSWEYPENFSGKWQDVKCSNKSIPIPTTTTSTAPSRSTVSVYTVQSGDEGWRIAESLGCSVDELKVANPGVNWDMLQAGQILNNPGATNTTSGFSAHATSSLQSNSVTTNSLATTQSSGVNVNPGLDISTTTMTLTQTNTADVVTSTHTQSLGDTKLCSTVTVTVTASCTSSSQQVAAPSRTSFVDSSLSKATSIDTKAGEKTMALGEKGSSFLASSSTSLGMVRPVTSVSTTKTRARATTNAIPAITSLQTPLASASAAPPVITVIETRTTVATITLTKAKTVCQTVTTGDTGHTTCSETLTTIVTATPVTTVVSVPSPIGNQSSTPTPEAGSSMVPLTPFVTTVTVPCALCVGGTKTVISTCSTITSITTITIGCSSCPNGSKTVISTTTISLTEQTNTTTPVGPVTTSRLSTTTSPSSSSSVLMTSSTQNAVTSTSLSSLTYSTMVNSSFSSGTVISTTRSSSMPTTISTYSSETQRLSTTSQTTPNNTATSISSAVTASTTRSSSMSPSVSSTTSSSLTTPSVPTWTLTTTTTTTSISQTVLTSTTLALTSKTTSAVGISTTTGVITLSTTGYVPSSTSTSTETPPSPPRVCTQDKCLSNMLQDNHIEDAHEYAPSFCKDRDKPTPTWLTDCKDRAAATSAFQCVTASATPVPSEDKDGKKCFKFGEQRIWGHRNNRGSGNNRGGGGWGSWNKREEQSAEDRGFMGRFGGLNRWKSRD